MTAKIIELTDDAQFNNVLEIIKEAHKSNISNGLIYATANLELSELIKRAKIYDGITLLAFLDDMIIGTTTVCFRELNYWYHSGQVATIKLVAVDPNFKGYGVADKLIKECISRAKERNINVIVSDTAEKNIAMKKIFLQNNFVIADFCKYDANNFYSQVYVKWINGCPYDNETININYSRKRQEVISKNEKKR